MILTMITNLGKVSERAPTHPALRLGSSAMEAAVANTLLTRDLA